MKKFRLSKSFLSGFLTILAGLVLMGFLLVNIYNQNAVKDQYDNSTNKLDVAVSRLSDYQQDAEENEKIFDSFSQGRASILSYYLEQHPQDTDLSWLVSQCHVNEYYYVNAQGELLSHSGNAWQNQTAKLNMLIKSGDPVQIDSLKYYCTTLSNGSSLIIGRDYTKETEELSSLQSPSHSLSSIVVGQNGYIEEISLNDNTILYSKNEEEIGQAASSYGIDTAVFTDGYAGRVTLHGEDVYVVARTAGTKLLLAIAPWSEIQANYVDIEAVNIILVAVTLMLMLIYAELIRHQMAKKKPVPLDYKQIGKHLYINVNILSSMRNIIIMGIVGVFLLTYYIHTLSPLSHQGIKNEIKVTAVSELLDVNEQQIDTLKQQYTDEYTQRAQGIAYLLYKDPALASSDSLKEICSRGGLDDIYLFDENGHAVSSSKTFLNYSLSTDPENPSYVFWSVINGYHDSAAEMSNDKGNDTFEQYIGVSRQDGLGMVEIKISSQVMSERLKANQLSYLLSHIAVVNHGFLFAVNTETHQFDYIPQENLIDHSASDYGMKDSAFVDGYEGIQTINGTKYLIDGVLHGDDYIYCAVPLSSIYNSRMATTLWSTLISALMIFVITMMLVLSREPIPEEPEEPTQEKTEDTPYFHHNTVDGRKRLIQSATSRYETHVSWQDKTPDQKLYTILGGLIIAASVAMVCFLAYLKNNSSHTVLHYVMDQKWEKGINIFSLTFIVLSMLEIIVITWIIRKSILIAMKKFGARSETVGHLLDSFLKYAAVIGGAFYCLNAIGLDSTALLASASILGLMLSFGAQSLIGDILAGIFIVFEGEFRVGDIVTIGDWRGTVVEIGIRTTKVLSAGHDVKIFNNSEIKQVINMTKQYSTAVVDVGIEYSESLERVEAVLKKELPHIKEHIPAIIEGPYYRGVTSLGESSVNIRILAECPEKERIQVVRDLNREIKLVFDRNHISIPYPQIVVNQPAQHVEATNEDKMNANKFLKEQKEATDGIIEAHDE